jgi:hypothetical protein
LNLEKKHIRPDQYQGIITREAALHGWTNDTLQNVQVRVVLPDAESRVTSRGIRKVSDGPKQFIARPPVNSRTDLARFYGALFDSLSAKLESFDTEVQ